MKKHMTRALLAAAALGMGTAHGALPLASLFDSDPDLISDNSAENWIDVNTNGIVDVGDILWGIIGFGDINGTNIGSGTAYNELTAIQANVITQGPLASRVNVQGVTIADYFADALTPAQSAYFDWATGTINTDGVGPAEYTFTTALGASNATGTLGLVFEDTNTNYTRDSTVQAGLSSATDGEARLLLDTSTAGDVIFVTSAVNPLAAIGTIGTPATSVAGSSVFLDATIAGQAWPGLEFGPNITAGTGGFSTPSAETIGSGDPWPIFDNIDFTVSAEAVPAPAPLALLGAGLLALAGMSRKARRSKEKSTDSNLGFAAA